MDRPARTGLGAVSPAAFAAGETGGPAYDVAVIGGGLSGLTAAYRLVGRRVVVLETANEVGGNARQTIWQGVPVATGGTVLQRPQRDSRVGALLADLGLFGAWREIGNDAIVAFDRGLLSANWAELGIASLRRPHRLLDRVVANFGANAARSVLTGHRLVPVKKRPNEPLLADLFAYLEKFREGGGKFPDIPWSPASDWSASEFALFDAMPLRRLLEGRASSAADATGLTPRKGFGHLALAIAEAVLRVECLTLDEVSAYVGLGFLLGYLYEPLVSFPGGNAAISEALAAVLQHRPNATLLTSAHVEEVRAEANAVGIVYRHAHGRASLYARTAIIATSKRMARSLVPELEPERLKAIDRISYRGFVMATAALPRPLWPSYYGGYLVGSDDTAERNHEWATAGAFVVPAWAAGFAPGGGLLTLLKPVVDPEQQHYMGPSAEAGLVADARAEVEALQRAAGKGSDGVAEVRLWQWPHSIVAPTVGQCSAGVFAEAARPTNRIVFAGQDTFGLGNVDGAVRAGEKGAHEVVERLPAVSVSPTGCDRSPQ